MSSFTTKDESRMSRREFMKTAATGAGLALMGLPSGRSEAAEKYPHWGEAVVIRDESATIGPNIDSKVVREMLNEAVKTLTNGGGWPSLFSSYKSGETVGSHPSFFSRGGFCSEGFLRPGHYSGQDGRRAEGRPNLCSQYLHTN